MTAREHGRTLVSRMQECFGSRHFDPAEGVAGLAGIS